MIMRNLVSISAKGAMLASTERGYIACAVSRNATTTTVHVILPQKG